MGRRLHRLASEAAKFLAVGGVATLVAAVIFNALVHGVPWHTPGPMHDWPLSSYVLANLVGMVVSYRGSRSWAFRHREVVGAAGGRVSFFVINTLTMAVPLLLLATSRYLLGLDNVVADNVAANVVGLALGTAARFWAFRRFVFVTPRQQPAPVERELAS
jgi:putative flippase GtrA